jgi:integrase
MAGNIQRRPDGKWRARYRDANHREHARHFSRKRDAEQWLASQKVAIARGEWVEPARSKITIGEWLPAWLALQVQLKPSTMVRYEVALRCQILPRFEFVPLSRITHSEVASWVHGLTDEGLAPATVRYAHRVLSLGLTAAVRNGRLVRNVAEGVPLPRVVATPKRFLTHDQVQALAEACPAYGTLIRVLAYAGLRWGEVVALTAGRVDLRRRRIEVVEAITEIHGRVIIGTTKNHQRRSVPIPRFLADELARRIAGKAPGDLLFTAPEGGVLRNTNFRNRFFDPAADKAGLPGLTPHELRHTAASLAIAAGANVKADQLDRAFARTSADQMRTSRCRDQQNQAALPFEKPPEHAAG